MVSVVKTMEVVVEEVEAVMKGVMVGEVIDRQHGHYSSRWATRGQCFEALGSL